MKDQVTALPSFADVLSAWLAADSPQYMPETPRTSESPLYFGKFVPSSNQKIRISIEGLPADIVAKIPTKDGLNHRAGAIVGPSWTQNHGNVLCVYFSAYCNGWSLFAVGVYLPTESRWVDPYSVFTYR